LAFDSQTQYLGGPMLDWLWNPTRQPARSVSSAVVTTISGVSMKEVSAPNPLSVILASRRRGRS
jgi:hypothetical protein